MTDHTDLIARAREGAAWIDRVVDAESSPDSTPLARQMSEIQRSRANAIRDLTTALEAMTDERDALRAEKATLTAEAAVRDAEVKRLREALRQCGNFADWGGEVERLVSQALATDASAEGGAG